MTSERAEKLTPAGIGLNSNSSNSKLRVKPVTLLGINLEKHYIASRPRSGHSIIRAADTTRSNTAFRLFLSVLPCVSGLVFTDTAAEQP